MIPSSALCRTQEDLHRRRAADTSLENVRLVANNAAAAWAKEAIAAEHREKRQTRVREFAEAASALKAELESGDNLLPNENPDRGLANTPQPAAAD
jgi:hypothetical protein